MRKIVLFFVYCFIAIWGYSQQDPQWMTPLYFETADGQKDTVYFGYDPLASRFDMVIDTIFGDLEEFFPFDGNQFNAYVPYFYYPEDSIRKVSITNDLLEYSIIYFVGTGSFPLTMKWDSASYYSSNLPEDFFEIPNRPRARLDIYPEGFGCYPACYDDCFYVCTDSIYPEMHVITSTDMVDVFADSVVFNCPDNYDISDLSVMIRVRPFDSDQMWWADLLSNSCDNTINIYPNPASDFVYIENMDRVEYIYFYSLQGSIVLMERVDQHESKWVVDVSGFEDGSYYIIGRSINGVEFAEKIAIF